ncbi:hypothetical protein Ancab_028952, partial [Ancistrocladus abbreviatus]
YCRYSLGKQPMEFMNGTEGHKDLPHHSQPPIPSPGSLGLSFPHGRPPLPSQLPPQPLYQIELQASKQREAALEAALVEKEFAEEECRKKVDEAKKKGGISGK